MLCLLEYPSCEGCGVKIQESGKVGPVVGSCGALGATAGAVAYCARTLSPSLAFVFCGFGKLLVIDRENHLMDVHIYL